MCMHLSVKSITTQSGCVSHFLLNLFSVSRIIFHFFFGWGGGELWSVTLKYKDESTGNLQYVLICFACFPCPVQFLVIRQRPIHERSVRSDVEYERLAVQRKHSVSECCRATGYHGSHGHHQRQLHLVLHRLR